MRPAASVAEFLAAPVGRYITGRAFVAWAQSPTLVGAGHFGAFDAADLPALAALIELPMHAALAPPCDMLHDLGTVDVLDRRAFQAFAELIGPRMPDVVARARRLAVVRPAGLAGAAFTGLFHDWTGTGVDAALFPDRHAALAWLGASAAALAEIDEAAARFEASPLLRRIRDVVAHDPAGATVASVAVAVGHSTRSLQRQLAEAGTSFRDELGRARVTAAKARLVETDDKVEVIARELGFASLAAFTTMFGKATGEPPHAFRQRRR